MGWEQGDLPVILGPSLAPDPCTPRNGGAAAGRPGLAPLAHGGRVGGKQQVLALPVSSSHSLLSLCPWPQLGLLLPVHLCFLSVFSVSPLVILGESAIA